jgi:O-antigen/teichoic acid export membrane protein
VIRKLLKDSAVYTVANLFTKGIGFLLLPIYIRLLTQSEYGYLDYVNALSSFVVIIIGFEIIQGLFRFLPEFTGNSDKRNRFINSVFLFYIVSYSVFSCVVIINEDKVSTWIFDDVSKVFLVRIVVVYLIASSLQNFVGLILLAEQAPKSVVAVSFTSALLSGLFSVGLLSYTDWGLLGLYIGNTLGVCISILVGIALIKPNYKIKPELTVVRQLLAFSLPLVPSSIGVMAMTFVDRLMIKEMMSIESVASYGVAVKIASIVLLVTIGFQSTLSPLIYSQYKEPDTQKFIAKLFHAYMLVTCIFVVIFNFISFDVLQIVAGANYIAGAQTLIVLVLANITSSFYLFFPGLSIASKTSIIAIINIAAGILNTGLNFVLIKAFGTLGAAYASLISITFSAFLTFYIAQKFYDIPIKKIFIFMYYGVISLVFIFSG